MGEIKHTPGPWTVAEDGDNLVVQAGEYDVATVHGGFLDPNRQKANAHIIVAAPEMEAVLETVLVALDAFENGGAYPDFDRWKLAARRALAKARVESCSTR